MQWSVSIGQLDVATAVMTMSKFRAPPRRGHLERARRIVGCFSKMNEAMIRFRVGKQDMSTFQHMNCEWEQSVHSDCNELTPEDTPVLKGETTTVISFVDANLMHDVPTGRHVTGVIHLLNKTPVRSSPQWKLPPAVRNLWQQELLQNQNCTKDMSCCLLFIGSEKRLHQKCWISSMFLEITIQLTF